jgi:altronate hydrolase
MEGYIRLSPRDNVAVALRDGLAVPMGHKIALGDISNGEDIIKYGFPIGEAAADIKKGGHVHVHNVKTKLDDLLEYRYNPSFLIPNKEKPELFSGYLRGDGSAGIRNEIWIINTVCCVNTTCRHLADMAARQLLPKHAGKVSGVYTFNHPYGCSQMGEDHENTQKALAGLVKHPNAAGVLVVGLGCENNHVAAFKEALGSWDEDRVKFMVAQEVSDEYEEGLRLLAELMEYAAGFDQQALPVSMLKVGLKCGGSDGFSGITANPLIGRFSDMLISRGGSCVLTEVPEMFGAETILMDRCINEGVFNKTVNLINDFKLYYHKNGQVIYENPSPGNKDGGITTLEDKSLGCTQKGGTAPVMDVLAYGEQVKAPGLSLLSSPGNDLVAETALAAAGCQLVLFSTGRGTPLGAPVPTVKIATNSQLAQKKTSWIDFDAGRLLSGCSVEDLGGEFYDYILGICSGKALAKNEIHGFKEIGIFKNGVTL